MLAATSLMLDTWASLTAAERKAVKDLFSELLHDPKVPPSPTSYVSGPHLSPSLLLNSPLRPVPSP